VLIEVMEAATVFVAWLLTLCLCVHLDGGREQDHATDNRHNIPCTSA
jgi:hypothetical protein